MIKVITAIKTIKLELINIKSFLSFPIDNFKKNKLNDRISYPLQAFKKTKKILTEKDLQPSKTRISKKNRLIEEIQTNSRKNRRFFSNYPNKCSTERNTKYPPKSVEKTTYLNVFLGALIISQEFNSKTARQQLS